METGVLRLPNGEGLAQAEGAALSPILGALKQTDELIDEIVYRLYGLSEEEIAVVKGQA
jgi:hypothetical protein